MNPDETINCYLLTHFHPLTLKYPAYITHLCQVF